MIRAGQSPFHRPTQNMQSVAMANLPWNPRLKLDILLSVPVQGAFTTGTLRNELIGRASTGEACGLRQTLSCQTARRLRHICDPAGNPTTNDTRELFHQHPATTQRPNNPRSP